MEDQPLPQQKETPPWLKHLQENSWEAEILISGGAIFSLFQLAEGLINGAEYFKEVTPFNGLNELLMISMVILRGVTICFIVHLFLRGVWIALVCLNGVYPDGINFQRLKMTQQYQDKSRKVTLTDQIIHLDKVSGLVFFGAFLFIIILLGLVLMQMIIMTVVDSIFGSSPWSDRIFLLFGFLAIVYAIDFVTAGILRRNTLIGKYYAPIFSFFNTLSLGALYRPSLQVLTTNVNRWRAGFFLLSLFIISIFFSYISLQSTLNWTNIFDKRIHWGTAGRHYSSDDLYEDRIPNERRVWRACIQSDFIKDDYLRVFIPYKARYNEYIENNNIKFFSEIISVSINDSTYRQIDWSDYGRQHSGQRGIISYLPITHLSKGKNELAIQIKGQAFYREQLDKLIIPFWKE